MTALAQSTDFEPLIDVLIRPARDSDIGFVVKSWVDAMTIGSRRRERSAVRCDDWKTIKGLLTEPEVSTILACHPSNHDELYGWLCYSDTDPNLGVVHMGYVKRAYRGMGLFRALWQAADIPPRFVYTYNPRGIAALLPHLGQAEYLPIKSYLKGANGE